MEPKKAIENWLPFLFSLVLIVGMFLGYKMSNSGRRAFLSSTTTSTHLDDLLSLLASKYVDPLDKDSLYQLGIEGIISRLDPHTVYIPANKLERANEELEGNFYGIGIEFYILNDTLHISGLIPGGPSEKLNIVPGDQIIKIDDSLVAGKQLDNDEVIRRIRGKEHSSIQIELRRVDGSIHRVTIPRGNVPLRSVTAYFMVNVETGYIKISMFSETTHDEFDKALESLLEQGAKKLLIDVRDNPGGYMDAVADVADELLPGKHLIVRTKGQHKEDSLMAEQAGQFELGQLCILIDENAASASEILAGAIQDLDRGLIIGRRSFGKGLVQEQFELPDHSALRITTARYYLPSGRCIQKSYAEGKEKYRHDIYERFNGTSKEFSDSIHKNKKTYFTLKGRKVYGDEGISPDILVPLENNDNGDLLDFYSNHVAERFAQSYYFFHRSEFLSFKTLARFNQEFMLNENMKSSLRTYLIALKLTPEWLNNMASQKEIENNLRAQFAACLFGNNGKYNQLYRNDAFINAALREMKSKAFD